MRVLAYVPGTRAWRERRDRQLCQRTAQRLQEIVDGELPPGRATRALERHLAACERCGGEAEVIRALKRAIARVGGEADSDVVQRLEDLARRLCEGTEARGGN